MQNQDQILQWFSRKSHWSRWNRHFDRSNYFQNNLLISGMTILVSEWWNKLQVIYVNLNHILQLYFSIYLWCRIVATKDFIVWVTRCPWHHQRSYDTFKKFPHFLVFPVCSRKKQTNNLNLRFAEIFPKFAIWKVTVWINIQNAFSMKPCTITWLK